MNYKITYRNPSTQYIPIEAVIPCEGLSTLEVHLPAWRPGRYELANFAKNIHSFSVEGDDGKKLSFRKTEKDAWLITLNKTKSVRVRYSYYAAELNAGSTFMNDQQLYVNPVNCLVYVNEQIDEPCELLLDIPDSFKLACGAETITNTDGKKIIRKSSFHELADSPFIASPALQHNSYTIKKTVFHLWFQGEVRPDWDKLIVDFRKFTQSQLDAFGMFPAKEYHFLFQVQPHAAYHGVEHQASTVLSLGPGYDLMTEGYDDLLGVCSHELYHAWNVKTIRPADMFPYDYSKENYSKLGYVCEGVTTYMGDLFLSFSQVRDFGWYRKELEKLLQRHFDNFARFHYSVAESGFDTWLDGYVPGAPNRKVSIYNEGALLALATDLRIRKNTANKASLHDVMAAMNERFALTEKGYTEADYQHTVEEFAGENLDELFHSYYNGVHSFETILYDAFESVGLELKMNPNPNAALAILGIKTAINGEKTIIKLISPGSSAELGGLMLEDEVIAINGFRVNGNVEKWVQHFRDSQIEATVSRSGRILNLLCPHTNKSYYPVYTLAKAKAPSNLHKRTFKRWCGWDWGCAYAVKKAIAFRVILYL